MSVGALPVIPVSGIELPGGGLRKKPNVGVLYPSSL